MNPISVTKPIATSNITPQRGISTIWGSYHPGVRVATLAGETATCLLDFTRASCLPLGRRLLSTPWPSRVFASDWPREGLAVRHWPTPLKPGAVQVLFDSCHVPG